MSEKAPITNTLSPETDREYKFFKDKGEIEDIRTFTKNTVEFLETLGESNIMFFDRSARLAYVAIDEYWNLKHGVDGLPKPKFYFINPDGFKLKYFVGSPVYDEDKLTEIDEELSHLDKGKPVVLIDVCIHTGNKMRNVFNSLNKIGFHDIKTIIASTRTNSSEIESEIPSIKSNTCCIFLKPHRTGDMIDKGDNSIFSFKRSEVDIERNAANDSRKELRQLIRDQFDK